MDLITINTQILKGDKITYKENIYIVTESNSKRSNPYHTIEPLYTIVNIISNETFNMFHSTLIHNKAHKL